MGLSEIGLGASGMIDDPFGIKGAGSGKGGNLRKDTAALLDFINQRNQFDSPELDARQRMVEGAETRFVRSLDPLKDIADSYGTLGRDLYRQQRVAANQAASSRQGQQSAIERLSQLARGQGSVVDAQTKVAGDQLARAIAGQQASQRGRFNPGGQLQALRTIGQGQLDLGSRAVAAKAEEQQNALQALLNAQAQQRQQDMTSGALAGTQAGQRAGITQQQAALMNAIAQQRLAAEQRIISGRDYARNQAERVAQMVAGVPLQPAEPNFLEKAFGFAGAALPLVGKAFGA